MSKKLIFNNYKKTLTLIYGKNKVNILIEKFNITDDNFDEWYKVQIKSHLQTMHDSFRDKHVTAKHQMEQGLASTYTLPYPEYLKLMKANMEAVQEDIDTLLQKGSIRKNVVEEVFRVLLILSKALP